LKAAESQQGNVALAFAKALANNTFREAHEMLTEALQKTLSEGGLKQEYLEMIEYGDGEPDFVDVMEVLNDWPGKQHGDVGWAYAAISGPGFSEAVAVVVSQEHGSMRIRAIEWGRP
jgi:hypothetical protein